MLQQNSIMGSIAIESLLDSGIPDVQDNGFNEASQAPADDTVLLSTPDSSVQIEYLRDAMETIRKRAWEAMMVSPRVGIAVGGLLVGVREYGRIRLLDSIDLPCSHSMGPSFNLTADEKRESADLIAALGALDVSDNTEVIGWYCSKTRGCATLNETDLNLHEGLFPGAWQIALVVRPSVVDPMHAAFFLRDENGEMAKRAECEVDVWWSAPEGETEAAATEIDPPTESEFVEAGLSDLLNLSSSVVRPFVADNLLRPPVDVSVPEPEPKAPPLDTGKVGWVLAASAALTIGILAKLWSKSRQRTR